MCWFEEATSTRCVASRERTCPATTCCAIAFAEERPLHPSARLSTSKAATILHTGDLTHLAEAKEFDSLEQNLKGLKTGQIFYVPGEHDVLGDNGAQYRERFAKNARAAGWYSFEKNGVHFVGLVNVVNTKEGDID